MKRWIPAGADMTVEARAVVPQSSHRKPQNLSQSCLSVSGISLSSRPTHKDDNRPLVHWQNGRSSKLRSLAGTSRSAAGKHPVKSLPARAS